MAKQIVMAEESGTPSRPRDAGPGHIVGPELVAELEKLRAESAETCCRFGRVLYCSPFLRELPVGRAFDGLPRTNIGMYTMTEFGSEYFLGSVVGVAAGSVALTKLFVPQGQCGGILRGEFRVADLAAAVADSDAQALGRYFQLALDEKTFRNNVDAHLKDATARSERAEALWKKLQAAAARKKDAEDTVASATEEVKSVSAGGSASATELGDAADRLSAPRAAAKTFRRRVDKKSRKIAVVEEEQALCEQAAIYSTKIADEIRDNVPLAERESFRAVVAAYRWALATGIQTLIKMVAGDSETPGSLVQFIEARDAFLADPVEFRKNAHRWAVGLKKWTPAFGNFMRCEPATAITPEPTTATATSPAVAPAPGAASAKIAELEARAAGLRAAIAELAAAGRGSGAS